MGAARELLDSRVHLAHLDDLRALRRPQAQRRGSNGFALRVLDKPAKCRFNGVAIGQQ
jgi:hypothetical protein